MRIYAPEMVKYCFKIFKKYKKERGKHMKIKLKRMTSLMLAVLMVCGMFPMPSFAAEGADLTPPSVIYDRTGKVRETNDKNEQLSDGQVILTKEAEATSVPNQYKITLTVRGKGAKAESPGADIVLVMDKSGSMKAEGMAALKKAAEAFIDIVLADGKSNRVSLVEYNYDATTATKFYSYTEKATAKNKIPNSCTGGTNTQDGLYQARIKLAESDAKNKFVVLISDGMPSYNAIPIINAQWSGERSDWKNDDYADGNSGNLNWYTPEWDWGENWSRIDSSKAMTAIIGYDYSMRSGDGNEDSYKGYALGVLKDDKTKTLIYTEDDITINSSDAAIYEAGLIKDTGAEIYTVAYITSDASNSAKKTLNRIASDKVGKTYTYTTSDNLENVFKSIGESINESISGGVTDPMGSFIDIGTATKVTGEVKNKGNFKVSNGTVRFEGDTFTWAPNVGETASTLSYIVELDVEAEGFIQNKVYDTNGRTTMEYSIGDAKRTGEFNVPSVKGTYSQIYRIGYRVNENNQYIDENGNVVDKEKAAIFAKEAVGNPHAEGRNQWKPGRNAVVNAFDGGKNYELVSKNAESFTTDGASDYVAEFNYVVKQYDYTVKYYVDGEYQSEWDENGKAIYNAVIETYENKCPTGYKLEKTENLPLTIKDGENVIKIYYVKDNFSYTVNYYMDSKENEPFKTEGENAQFGTKIPYNVAENVPEGYKTDAAVENANGTVTENPENNIVNIIYTKRDDLSYIVNYLEQGTNAVLAAQKVVANQEFGKEVTEEAIDITGYNKIAPTEQTITIKVTDNVINFYYTKRADLSYTVNYLEQGTNAVLADPKVVTNQEFGKEVTETAIEINGYNKVDPTSASIILDKENQVINFYYTKKTDLSYIVKYLEVGSEKELHDSKTDNNQTFGDEVTENAVAITGYELQSEGSKTIKITTGVNEIIFWYAKKSDLAYVVNYYEEGTTTSVAPSKTVDKQTFGASVTENAIDVEGYVKVAPTTATITIAETGNVINFYYNKRTDLSYEVNYLEKDTNVVLAAQKVVDKQTFGAVVTENAIEIAGYDKVAPTSATITIIDGENVINFYYNKRTDLQYTVRYLEKGTEIELHDEKAVTGKTYMSEVTEDAVIIDGYVVDGATSQTVTLDADNKVITFWYNKRNDLGYTVKYLEKDTNKVLADNKVVGGKTLGEVITEEAIEITGYNKVEPTTGTVTITTGLNEIIFWYEARTDLSYEVNYLEKDTNEVLAAQKTADGQTFGEEVTENAIEIAGYDKVAPTEQTITIKVEGNVINFYYTKRTDLTYTVNYYEENTTTKVAESKVVTGQTYKATVNESAIDVTGYSKVEPTSASITIELEGNVINFYYNKNSYPYIVNYYKDSAEEGNFLGTDDGASKLYGTQLDEAMVTADLGEGWLNALRPEGYLETTVIEGEYPVIDVENNVINVVYRRNDNLQYTVKYYKDAVVDENLLGTDVTEGVTLGDMVFADNGPVPMAMISLYTFEVFKYLPAGYAEEAYIENAPLTVGANVNENLIIVVYKAREKASLTINKTVADIENETAGTTFFFKVTSDKLESPMYVSAVIEEIDGVKTIAPVVIENLEWGKYTVTEVIYNDGAYIEDLTRFDYTVSGTGDVHVGGENIEANIDIINTRREGGSLVISKVASGAFNPDTVYEFALYLSHMRYNEVTEGKIEEATALLETLKAALLEAETLRDTKKAEYDAIMAEVVNAEANLALAKAPIEKATLELELAKAEKLTAEEMLKVMQDQLDEAQAKEAPAEVPAADEPAEIVEEPTAPVAPTAPTAPTASVAPVEPTNPGEFTETAPNPPSQPTVEEGADEETIANALADYEAAYAAYETALAEFENAKSAHEALVAQYEAEMAEYTAYDAQAAGEAYQAALAEYETAMTEYNALNDAYVLELAEYETAKAAFDAYTEQLEAFEAYTAYLAELEAFTLLQEETIPQLTEQIAEMTAALEAKTEAVADAETALETAEAESAEVIAAAELALENAKTLASENGSEEALAALETAEKAVVDAQNAVTEAEEALRHLMSANDPTKRSADEVILVDNEMLTPIVENDITVGYTFTLKSGESLILTDLPADAVYEVIEIDNGGADETYIGEVMTNEESGLIDTENGSVVAFTNVFIPDKTITVTKSYEGNVYNGTVVIDIFRVTEEGDELVDTVRIAGNGSATVIVEDFGEYKAVERDVENYIPSYGENAVLTEDNINGTLTVTNTYDPPYVPPYNPPAEDNYYKVTVIYINEETGEELIGRYTTGSILEGSEYDVTGETMVEIEGFEQTGVEGETSGILNGDVTVIVYYVPAEEIIEEEVPLAPPAEEEIIEEDIPLIDLPKTGGVSGLGFCMVGIAALAAGIMLKCKEEDEE